VRAEGFAIAVTQFWKAPLQHWVFPSPGIRIALGVAVNRVYDQLEKVSVIRDLYAYWHRATSKP
jgi:hypothetical protein